MPSMTRNSPAITLFSLVSAAAARRPRPWSLHRPTAWIVATPGEDIVASDKTTAAAVPPSLCGGFFPRRENPCKFLLGCWRLLVPSTVLLARAES